MSSMLTPLELDLAHEVIRERLAEAERDALADQLRRAHSTRPVAESSALPRVRLCGARRS